MVKRLILEPTQLKMIEPKKSNYENTVLVGVVNDSQDEEKLSEFLEDLSVKVFEQIQKFFEETPKLSYTIKYKNSLDNKREIHLNSLNDFFTLR